jgi:hypothetical protein
MDHSVAIYFLDKQARVRLMFTASRQLEGYRHTTSSPCSARRTDRPWRQANRGAIYSRDAMMIQFDHGMI